MFDWLKVLISRIHGLLARRQLDKEFQQELDAHLEMLTEENTRRGLPPQEARRAARLRLGGTTQLRETGRELWGLPWLETLVQDVRYGLRQLRRNPDFSAAAILIIGLGIAAACIIFSFAEAAVIRALPYPHPSSLVNISMIDVKAPDEAPWVSAPVLLNWRERGKKIGRFAGSYWASETMVGSAEPVQLFVDTVSEGAFDILGVPAILGRTLWPSDYKPGGASAVVLSYRLWWSRFDAKRDVLGRSILLDGVNYKIVGVMPPGFLVPGSGAAVACWTPLVFTAKDKSDARDQAWEAWGRLNSGVSVQQAQAALGTLTDQVMNPEREKRNSEWRINVAPMIHDVLRQWRSALIMLLGAVVLLLAIACVNVGNLLLARANSRQKEITVRVALGANRRRVIRQLLSESVILGAFGGGLGILLARWAIKLETVFLPQSFQFDAGDFQHMGIDSTVLSVTLIVSIVVGITFGLAPAVHASNVNLVESLKESGQSASSGRGQARTQSVFVIGEVALSLILLIGAGLLLRSFLQLQSVDLGFNPEDVLTMQVLLPQYQYPTERQHNEVYQQVLEKVKRLPGVRSSALVAALPFTGFEMGTEFPAQPGMANSPGSNPLGSSMEMVSPGYFETMGIPLVAGRTFTEQDMQNSQPVAIVNEAFAQQAWPGQNPLGREISEDYPKRELGVRIVGVVRNAREDSSWGPPGPGIYYPYWQHFFPVSIGSLVAKTSRPASTAAAMLKVIHAVDRQAPISQVLSMDEVLARSRAGDRFYLLLVGVFGLLALLLGAAGIASTVSYAVGRRKHEIGIRMALGADRGAIVRLMVGQTLKLALLGVAGGIAGSLALTRFVSSQLHGVSRTDPITFIAVSLLTVGVCLIAAYIPARAAARVNAIIALRYE
ncbi:MAG TPA: ABC transporter permease [Terriglobia bacterium]|nr:ABC transporter permease [Terriglobia bacterium]